MKLEDHPTVQRIRAKTTTSASTKDESLDAIWMKQLILDAGADDVGFVEIGRPALDDQREDILKAFPHTKTLVSFVVRMNREAIRTPSRSVSNLEFHHSGEEVNHIARSVSGTERHVPLHLHRPGTAAGDRRDSGTKAQRGAGASRPARTTRYR